MKRHFRGGLVGLAGGVSWGGYPAAGCLRQRRHGGTNRYPFAGADQDWSGTCCERPNLGCARTAKGATAVNLRTDFQIEAYQGEDVLGGKNVQFSRLFGRGQPVV